MSIHVPVPPPKSSPLPKKSHQISAGPDPAEARATKRARTDLKEDGKQMNEGAKWLLGKIEEMERAYQKTIMATTLIMRYRTSCLRIGVNSENIPVHLVKRLRSSWSTYESLRRHVESYMSGNNQSSLSKLAPIPLTGPSLSLLRTGTTTINAASPVPLSQVASNAFDPTKPQTPPLPAPTSQLLPVSQPQHTLDLTSSTLDILSQPSSYPLDTDTIDFSDGQLYIGSDNDPPIDLSNIALSELSAFMNGGAFGDIPAEPTDVVSVDMISNIGGNGEQQEGVVNQTNDLLALLDSRGDEGMIDPLISALPTGDPQADQQQHSIDLSIPQSGANDGHGTQMDISALMGLFDSEISNQQTEIPQVPTDGQGATVEEDPEIVLLPGPPGVHIPEEQIQPVEMEGDYLAGIDMDDLPGVDGEEFRSLLDNAFN
ncbi:hypothetical protein M231_00975 [Tremella mesenterica]|uniref:SERTA domain-containing protein n=1 Tax=Tremella mesenterica TaxID=5217 RepID=A0A4Q1BUM7_TREME|nr:hypothetical protein M231_00975 [Tremella mesenterica]